MLSIWVDTNDERTAMSVIIGGIEAGTKRGDTVYEVVPVMSVPSGPSIRAYGKGGELY